jgi:hypothetical protein
MHMDSAQTADPWKDLETTCTDALGLANHIAGQLRQGSQAHALTPLLQQANQLACCAQQQIQRLASQPGHPQAAASRDRILKQMSQWLALEEQNHRICSRRGVSLTGPRRPSNKTRKSTFSTQQPVHATHQPTISTQHPTTSSHHLIPPSRI